MHHDPRPMFDLSDLVNDPLTRLVMASDGVSAAEFLAVMDRVWRAPNGTVAGGAWPWLRVAAPRRDGRRGTWAVGAGESDGGATAVGAASAMCTGTKRGGGDAASRPSRT